MRKPPPWHGGGGRHSDRKSIILGGDDKPRPAPPQALDHYKPETHLYVRRECRKCPAAVWEIYFFGPDGAEQGWGLCPIDPCQNSQRCGEKFHGLGDEPTLFDMPAEGGA